MKNKPYPALLRPSNLSNEIGKRVPKSRETIPLKVATLHTNSIYNYYLCGVDKKYNFTHSTNNDIYGVIIQKQDSLSFYQKEFVPCVYIDR
jgi:hypothetical protein